MITPESALPGRDSRPLPVSAKHAVLGSPLEGPWPEGSLVIYLGAGCYWGVEEIFWQTPGVINTSVGFMGGFTPHPTYEETCTGRTGHTETALVVYNPEIISTVEILKIFWENHDPTQGMRQGNDVGTQYRSCIYVKNNDLYEIARNSQITYQRNLEHNNIKEVITTEISLNKTFYYEEDYHQQYLEKNPLGYCGIQGTGIKFLD